MSILAFGKFTAWAAFFTAFGLILPLAIAARLRPLWGLIRPLALLGLIASACTASNGLARLADWSVSLSYAQMLAAGAESNADVLATMLIPIWPYGAVAFGLALALAYGAITWRTAGFIAFMRPSAIPGERVARERARVARFDE